MGDGVIHNEQEMALIRATPKKALVGGLIGGIIGAIIGALLIWLLFHCGCPMPTK